uniref:Uncharacterized protein n=1 Tax=Ditylenchus dipsaci TaxID=166011 RepID=A0A915D4X6_9BILA
MEESGENRRRNDEARDVEVVIKKKYKICCNIVKLFSNVVYQSQLETGNRFRAAHSSFRMRMLQEQHAPGKTAELRPPRYNERQGKTSAEETASQVAAPTSDPASPAATAAIIIEERAEKKLECCPSRSNTSDQWKSTEKDVQFWYSTSHSTNLSVDTAVETVLRKQQMKQQVISEVLSHLKPFEIERWVPE